MADTIDESSLEIITASDVDTSEVEHNQDQRALQESIPVSVPEAPAAEHDENPSYYEFVTFSDDSDLDISDDEAETENGTDDLDSEPEKDDTKTSTAIEASGPVIESKLDRCKHYNRGCHLLFPCCNEYFPCRLCHDEKKTHYAMDPKLMHEADRKTVTTMRCRYCLETQDIDSVCKACAKPMGSYFCKICKLLDLDDKKQFHCDGCGICRIGGRDNFMHCEQCGLCVVKSDDHKCARKIEGDCSVCCRKLFDTAHQTMTNLKCGHWMHTDCFKSYVQHNYKCPLCSKSLVDNNSMTQYIDHQIATTPMPEEYRDKMVDILCNECNTKSNVKLHFYGLKCPNCSTYNTRQIKPD